MNVPSKRTSHIKALQRSLGDELLQITDLGTGWPALCRLRIGDTWRSVAIHLGPVGLSHRGRDTIERRFQNPGQGRPIVAPAGHKPLLVGVSYSQNGAIQCLVGMDPYRRLGDETRKSLFVPVDALNAGAAAGWIDHVSTSGETIHVFRPEFLPVLAALGQSVASSALPELADIARASGFLAMPDDPEASKRARVAALRAARRCDFGRRVVEAYMGECSMCGLDSGLVDGAHIYPVAAPGSSDALPNGLALCPNHHRGFDRHLLFVGPESGQIHIHAELTEAAASNKACSALVESTRERLLLPRAVSARPAANMFQRRYAFFSGAYAWGPGS